MPSDLLRTVETARCTGHCCREFPLPFGPEKLKEQCRRNGQRNDITKAPVLDGDVIADMVVYRGFRRWSCDNIAEELQAQSEMHFYTCRHFDKESGDCAIYETRPRMCKDYPYRGTCGHSDCARRTKY
ncbi:hypothetical protein LCGC14_2832790, partial [marine sediment metagenome]